MKQIGLRVPEELLSRIDDARGLVPREPWIRSVLERAVAEPDEHMEALRDFAKKRDAPQGHRPNCRCHLCKP